MGRNGAGKSSLFSLLAGRLQPDAGDVEIPPALAARRGGAVDARDRWTAPPSLCCRATSRCNVRRAQLAAAEAADDGHAMAEAHMALDEAGAFDARAPCAGAAARPGLQERAARRAGEQLLRRLAHAAAACAGADVPGRPAAARRAPPTTSTSMPSSGSRPGCSATTARCWSSATTASSSTRSRRSRCTSTKRRSPATPATTTAFEAMRGRAHDAGRRRLRQAAGAHRAPASDSSTASRPRRARPSRRKAASKALARMEKLAPVLTASDFAFEFREPASLPNPMLAMRDMVCGYGRHGDRAQCQPHRDGRPAHRHPRRQRPGANRRW